MHAEINTLEKRLTDVNNLGGHGEKHTKLLPLSVQKTVIDTRRGGFHGAKPQKI